MVDALAVEDTHLIVKPVVAIVRLEKVALYLHTEVAAATLVLADSVVDAGQFHRGLRVGTHAYEEGRVGVLEAETTLELSELNAQVIKLLPFHECINNARTFVLARRAVDLQLETIVKVLEAVAVGVETEEAEVETAIAHTLAVLNLLAVVDGILTNDVAAKFEGRVKLSHQLLSHLGVVGKWGGRGRPFGKIDASQTCFLCDKITGGMVGIRVFRCCAFPFFATRSVVRGNDIGGAICCSRFRKDVIRRSCRKGGG